MASKTETRRVNIYINGKEVTNTAKAIRAEYRKVSAELNTMAMGSKEYNDHVKKLKGLRGQLDDHANKVRNVGKSWSSFKSTMMGMVAGGGILGAIQGIGRFIGKMVSSNAELADSFADVRKTTGLTAEEVGKLDENLRSIDTRSSRKELLDLATTAGRLGIQGSKNIEDFVKKADQINVALGEDLGEGAVLQIGKIADAFNTDLLKIGSAINEVGSNSKAQEAYLVEFTSRLQGVAGAANLSASDVIGYGAVLDSLGLKSEMSSTALSTFFMDFVKDTGKFEEAAGMAKGSLDELIGKEGTNQGFLAFMENLKKSSGSSDVFLQKLEDIGINGARGAQVFLALSENIDEVGRMQNISNDAFEKGTSLTNEFNVKNNNLAANLEKLSKWMSNLWANSTIMNGINKVVGGLTDLIKVPVSETMEKQATKLRLLEMQIYDTNTPTDLRIKLIKELKEQYPKHLSNIDAETVSNEELHKSLKLVNDMLVNKIILQRKQEKINAIAEEQADRQMAIDEKQEEIRRKLDKYANRHEITLIGADGKEQVSLLEQANKLRDDILSKNDRRLIGDANIIASEIVQIMELNKELEELNKTAYSLEEDKAEFLKSSGLETDEPVEEDIEKPEEIKKDGGLSDEEKKALEKRAKEVLAANQKAQEAYQKLREEWYLKEIEEEETREKEKLNMAHEHAIAEVEASIANKELKDAQLLALEDVHNQALDELTAKYEEKRAEKIAEEEAIAEENRLRIQEALMSDLEYKIHQEEMYWEDLMDLAEEGSAEYEALMEKKQQAVQKIIEESVLSQAEEMQKTFGHLEQAGQGFGDMMSGIMTLVGKEGEKMSEFQKAIALFEIAMNTGSAIAKAVSASAGQGLLGLATMAVHLGVIFSNMARAKGIVEGGDKPKYGKGTRLSGPLHSSASNGLPVINPETGQVEYYVEGGETVLSRETYRNNPSLVDALLDSSMNRGGAPVSFMDPANQRTANFDAISRSFATGGITPSSRQDSAREVLSSQAQQVDAKEIGKEIARQFRPYMEKIDHWPKSLNAQVNQKQMNKAQEELDTIRQFSGMGT